MPNVERLPEWLGPHDWRTGVKKALNAGIIKKADTIEGLADQLGLKREILTESVKGWNQVCAKGDDPEFGYEPSWLIPIAKGPFYGMRIGMQMGQTMCGLHINVDNQVIDTNGLPMKGLYAGTHTSGGTEAFAGGNGGSWTGGYCAAEGLLKSLKSKA
jgi:fumarate reductase flavoprotein subunit